MTVLVDSPIWSLMLRRRPGDLSSRERPLVEELRLLVAAARAEIIGAVRQELLSGIRYQAQYEALRAKLRAFSDVAHTSDDYERAAAISNKLRAAGIAVTPTDSLICATALNRSWSVFTLDSDFQHFAKSAGLVLHAPLS